MVLGGVEEDRKGVRNGKVGASEARFEPAVVLMRLIWGVVMIVIIVLNYRMLSASLMRK